jgi:hypothetical protein
MTHAGDGGVTGKLGLDVKANPIEQGQHTGEPVRVDALGIARPGTVRNFGRRLSQDVSSGLCGRFVRRAEFPHQAHRQ